MLPQFDVRKELAKQAREVVDHDLEERAALISEGCSVDQDEAMQLAVAQTRQPSRIEIFANRIEEWLKDLDLLEGRLLGEDHILLEASKRFALSVWAHPALSAGWTDAELFASPAGLVPQMALRNLHIMNIDETGVTLMTGRGIVETFERSRFRSGKSKPWWQK